MRPGGSVSRATSKRGRSSNRCASYEHGWGNILREDGAWGYWDQATVHRRGGGAWIVYGLMRTADAVSPAPGLGWGLVAVVAVYGVLTVFTVVVLRRLARSRVTRAPQEQEARGDAR